jgi:hypothetical protein
VLAGAISSRRLNPLLWGGRGGAWLNRRSDRCGAHGLAEADVSDTAVASPKGCWSRDWCPTGFERPDCQLQRPEKKSRVSVRDFKFLKFLMGNGSPCSLRK